MKIKRAINFGRGDRNRKYKEYLLFMCLHFLSILYEFFRLQKLGHAQCKNFGKQIINVVGIKLK